MKVAVSVDTQSMVPYGSWSLPPRLVIGEATLCSPSLYRVLPRGGYLPGLQTLLDTTPTPPSPTCLCSHAVIPKQEAEVRVAPLLPVPPLD